MVLLEAEMMVLFDTIQAAEVGGKKPGPISGRHDGTTILGTDQLADVTCRGLLDYTSQVVQRADVGSAKLPLDEAETGVRGELSVASDHEVQMDGFILHMRYCTMVFWPLQLSPCRLAVASPRP